MKLREGASSNDVAMRAQHAVAAWVQEHADMCEVIHGHEWGGVLVDAATMTYFRRLRQGARSVVTPHGGHMWSLQWKPQRSFSVEPLRFDHQVLTPAHAMSHPHRSSALTVPAGVHHRMAERFMLAWQCIATL